MLMFLLFSVFTIEGDLDRICDVWRDIMPKIKVRMVVTVIDRSILGHN